MAGVKFAVEYDVLDETVGRGAHRYGDAIYALSWEDARAQCEALGFRLLGEIVEEIPR